MLLVSRGLNGDSGTVRLNGKVRRVWYVPKMFAQMDKDQYLRPNQTWKKRHLSSMINLIFGPPGTGKTTYLLNEVVAQKRN